jgi:two-component system, LytTR family, sensor kinase
VQLKNFSSKKLILVYGLWYLGWTTLQVFVLSLSANIAFGDSVKDALVTSSLVSVACFVMINVMRVYQPAGYIRLVDSIGLAVLAAYAHKWLTPLVFTGNINYENFFQQTFIARCVFNWLLITVVVSTTWLWSKMQDEQQVTDRKNESERLAREAELSKLRLQLQPHFLFNSLNSISALVGTKPEAARMMVQQLSDFLRGTLKKDDQQLVELSQELEHLNLYLEIEKVRFGHRLQTEIKAIEDALDKKLPSLLLQPIVENAIKFGLYDTIGEIVIQIYATGDEQYLTISVTNPFDPATAGAKGTGFGLSSVQRRLYLLYARQDLLTTTQRDNTFITTLKIPQTL